MARRDDDYWRNRSKVLYRALRDDYGSNGATASDLMPLIGATDRAGVFMTLNWMRAHGVDVVCARAGDSKEPSRWALRSLLPEAWDTILPA
jgi:hypothetical protein